MASVEREPVWESGGLASSRVKGRSPCMVRGSGLKLTRF
jgi:hypothetical protein